MWRDAWMCMDGVWADYDLFFLSFTVSLSLSLRLALLRRRWWLWWLKYEKRRLFASLLLDGHWKWAKKGRVSQPACNWLTFRETLCLQKTFDSSTRTEQQPKSNVGESLLLLLHLHSSVNAEMIPVVISGLTRRPRNYDEDDGTKRHPSTDTTVIIRLSTAIIIIAIGGNRWRRKITERPAIEHWSAEERRRETGAGKNLWYWGQVIAENWPASSINWRIGMKRCRVVAGCNGWPAISK